MPAYSFQQRFVPFVKDGSKPHTVRNRRKNFCKIGDTCYLYYGLRTKWVTKLGESPCINTHSIAIDNFLGILFYSRLLNNQELYLAKCVPGHVSLPVCKILTPDERNTFAWMDGFRPEGSTKESPGEAYELMIRFWTITHQLPWAGDIIYWKPF
ncbi:MAG: hypothetical protein Q8L07_04180 [Sediminibacterium sp.]|nr:hypothetical protein [Sediminibacterium sp.]